MHCPCAKTKEPSPGVSHAVTREKKEQTKKLREIKRKGNPGVKELK